VALGDEGELPGQEHPDGSLIMVKNRQLGRSCQDEQ
jgi:hypothetical protein